MICAADWRAAWAAQRPDGSRLLVVMRCIVPCLAPCAVRHLMSLLFTRGGKGLRDEEATDSPPELVVDGGAVSTKP
eukprot:4170931-Alexandrium_andersonii.AAC.1